MSEYIDSIAYKAEHEIGDSFSQCYFSKHDGSYLTHVGMEEKLDFLSERGITEQIQCGTGGSVCNIGFSPKEQKWYGWSHRAIYGFGIGSEVKKGDCAYMPVDKNDFLDDMVRFWTSDTHLDVKGEFKEEVDSYLKKGVEGVYVSWKISDEVPNKKIRGEITGAFQPFPDEFGRGEWRAETLEDAKQMACDFASSVS